MGSLSVCIGKIDYYLIEVFFLSVAMFLGVWICVSLRFWNILGGLWQILAGFILICCEAPCCCMFIDHVQRLADRVDNRPYWNRALAYTM